MRACACTQSRQSIRCSHTQNMEVAKYAVQRLDRSTNWIAARA